MSEQYAFAIGFDLESNPDAAKDAPDAQAVELLEVIGTAIREAELPDLQSDRWDEFGQGRLFWGTRTECEAVKAVLTRYPVFIQEEQNLEPGFYADAGSTYYADAAGTLYRLLHQPTETEPLTLEPTATIPMEAYRLRSIDPSLEQAVLRSLPSPSVPNLAAPTPKDSAEAVADLQAQIAHLKAELNSLHSTAEAKHLSEAAYAELQNHCELQASQIHELERQITVFEDQMAALQTLSAAKVDPQLYADLQTQATQQRQELDALQAQLKTSIALTEYDQLQQQLVTQNAKMQELQVLVNQLEQQLQETATLAAQKIDPGRYQTLEHTAADQATLIEDLRRTIQQMERDLREWQTVAESKVDWSDYEALRQELRLLQAKPRKGVISRFWGWLFG